MRTVIFIPARFHSSRFPGKPLQPLRGADGEARTLIERTWKLANSVRDVDGVHVLTDDDRIAEAVRGFGGEVQMTSSAPRNGTERCAEGLAALEETPDIVINLQGDAPLTPPEFIEALIAEMRDNPGVAVATPVLRAGPDHVERLRADRSAGRVGATTVVFGAGRDALYFSKEIIPFLGRGRDDTIAVHHHVGVYAFRPEMLMRYASLPPGRLEKTEGLEQLRFLEHGIPVRCVEVDAGRREFWELNNPSDVARIEEIMAREGLS